MYHCDLGNEHMSEDHDHQYNEEQQEGLGTIEQGIAYLSSSASTIEILAMYYCDLGNEHMGEVHDWQYNEGQQENVTDMVGDQIPVDRQAIEQGIAYLSSSVSIIEIFAMYHCDLGNEHVGEFHDQQYNEGQQETDMFDPNISLNEILSDLGIMEHGIILLHLN